MKKLLAVILTLVLALGVTTSAFAATGTGKIKFTEGEFKVITKPDDDLPTPPGGGDPDPYEAVRSLTGASLDFGTRTIESGNKIYNSTDTGVEIAAADTYTDIVVVDQTGSSAQWTLNVSISAFTGGALNGFELKLLEPSTSRKTATSCTAVAMTTPITATAGSSFNILKGYGGIHGCGWYGELKVLNGTATAGEKQATMTWTVSNT